MNVVHYDRITGEKLGFYSGPEAQLKLQSFWATGDFVEINDLPSDIWYFPGGVPTKRPAMNLTADKTQIAADGIDEVRVTGIPVGATFRGLTINDGELIFTTNEPGEHRLVFELWPYIDGEVVVNAV